MLPAFRHCHIHFKTENVIATLVLPAVKDALSRVNQKYSIFIFFYIYIFISMRHDILITAVYDEPTSKKTSKLTSICNLKFQVQGFCSPSQAPLRAGL